MAGTCIYVDISWIHSCIPVEVLAPLADFYGCPDILDYLDQYYTDNLEEFHNYLHTLRQICQPSDDRLQSIVAQVAKTLHIKRKRLMWTASKSRLKRLIDGQLRAEAFYNERKRDKCRWCNKAILFKIDSLVYHKTLAVTPCCGLPLHRYCVLPMVRQGNCDVCHFCTTTFYEGRASYIYESQAVYWNRVTLRRKEGLSDRATPYFNTSFEREARVGIGPPRFITPVPPSPYVHYDYDRMSGAPSNPIAPTEHGDEDWS